MWNKLLWQGLPVTKEILCLKNTLMNGQCFNWKLIEGVYLGCVERRVIALKEEDEFIFYKFLYKNTKAQMNSANDEVSLEENDFFRKYFQFEVDISEIYASAKEKLPKNLHASLENYRGVRILRQEYFECIISFICSSNNNIERIRGMLENFRKTYGELIYEDDDYGSFYAFPSLQDFTDEKLKEKDLRDMGFGYRANYLVDSLKFMLEKGEDWFQKILASEDPEQELLKLKGVGRKVADCILLFSFGKHHIVPLDIHMIKFFNESVAGRGNKYKKIEKMNKKTYEEASANYFECFGGHAGWLHSIFYMSRIDKTPTKIKGKRKAKDDSDLEEVENNIKQMKKKK